MHTTIVLSTHDMVQGQRLADRIGVILGGKIAQTGTLTEIFYQPKNCSLARFVGADTYSFRYRTGKYRGACPDRCERYPVRGADCITAGQ